MCLTYFINGNLVYQHHLLKILLLYQCGFGIFVKYQMVIIMCTNVGSSIFFHWFTSLFLCQGQADFSFYYYGSVIYFVICPSNSLSIVGFILIFVLFCFSLNVLITLAVQCLLWFFSLHLKNVMEIWVGIVLSIYCFW